MEKIASKFDQEWHANNFDVFGVLRGFLLLKYTIKVLSFFSWTTSSTIKSFKSFHRYSL